MIRLHSGFSLWASHPSWSILRAVSALNRRIRPWALPSSTVFNIRIDPAAGRAGLGLQPLPAGAPWSCCGPLSAGRPLWRRLPALISLLLSKREPPSTKVTEVHAAPCNLRKPNPRASGFKHFFIVESTRSHLQAKKHQN